MALLQDGRWEVIVMLSLKNVKVPIDAKKDYEKIITDYLGITQDEIKSYKIHKESIDARAKHDFCYVYEFYVELVSEKKYLKNKNVTKVTEEKYEFPQIGFSNLENRPVIIGAGPAGLFASYMLAKHGYKPVLYERGEEIDKRVADVNLFWQTGNLKTNSNVQFGEGGAGTFSDGKLNTLVKDKGHRMQEVFDIFIECGAPEEIAYSNHPHIGTDKLREVVKNMRKKIIAWGGDVNFNCLLEDVIIENNKIKGIVINGETIDTDVLILATGHSARDTFDMLYQRGLDITSKPFAVGVRIVHPQKLIDERQYPKLIPGLPVASYKLTYTNFDKRGVYSFCMCPGGFVVDATSNKGLVVINGMSNYLRDSGYANSAIIVTVNESDFGSNPLDGLKYMEEIESKAYELTKGGMAIQRFKDFEEMRVSKDIVNIDKFCKGKTVNIDINQIFPSYINRALRNGINYFDNKIPGFKEGIILAPETRTSSPVRIIRNDELESNIKGIYPCGEGSGYAGGITTSAMDGIKVAEEIAKKYNNML